MLVLWLAAAFSRPAETVVLERGLGGYWSVEDTTLDSRDPEASRGGNAILEAGPGKTVLIQFRDIERAIGAQKRVVSARLELVYGGGKEAPKLLQIRSLKRPWTEGPIRALTPQMRGSSLTASRWAASWKYRRSGADADPWTLEGARGNDDATKLEGVTTSVKEDVFLIEGLGAAVEAMRARPYQNNGFALEIADAVDFVSSNAPDGRPRLVLEVEDAPAKSGPDLSVTLIRRTPEFPRFDPAYETVDGVEMPKMEDATVKRWPVEGEKLKYVAVVKNVGAGPVSSFKGRWKPQEKEGPVVEGKGLAPGESQSFEIDLPYRSLHSDHRTAPIGFSVNSPEDVEPSNDYLEIQQSALNFAVYVEPAFAEKLGPKWEDWVQSQLGAFNEILCRYSRYSFAPEGALERGRIQVLAMKPGSIPEDKNVDATVILDASTDPIRAFGKAFGLVDLRSLGSPDPFPGIFGGDSRSDAPFPPTYAFPYGPDPDPVADALALDVYGLLSAFDVAALTSSLGARRGYKGEFLWDLPESTLVTAQDRRGGRLAGLKLSFVQVGDTRETFNLTTNEGGVVTLPNRPIGAPSAIRALSKHTLRPNPFGRIAPDGKNAAFLVTAEKFGVTETVALESWQMTQNLARGQFPIGFITLRFNLPGAPLGDPVWTSPEAKPLAGDALDFDLGKDTTVGEIRIKGKNLWERFDLIVRGSSDPADKWRLFDKEVRTSLRAKDGVLVFRGLAEKVRYLRLVKVEEAGQAGGSVDEIVVVGTKG